MVITDVNQVVYQGDGATTAFPFTFRIIDATDIKLLLIDADGTETDITSDYFVDTNTNTVYYPGYAPGAEPGLADQPAPVQTGQRLVVYRELPVTQEKDLGEKWPFFVIELALDKLTMLIQQVKGIWDRCLKVSVGQEATAPDFDYTVPIEAGKTFRVKDDGTGFELTEDPAVAHAAAVAAQEAAERAQGLAEDARDDADEAAENAEAALDLIKEKATWFDNVAAMKAAAGLQVGMLAGTKGYYSINDGGSAIYNIRAKTQDDVDDGGSIIVLDNGNVAELIAGDIVNVKQFGAVGDGITDDTNAFRNAFAMPKLYIPAGNYLITDYLIGSNKVVDDGTYTNIKPIFTTKNRLKTISRFGMKANFTTPEDNKMYGEAMTFNTKTQKIIVCCEGFGYSPAKNILLVLNKDTYAIEETYDLPHPYAFNVLSYNEQDNVIYANGGNTCYRINGDDMTDYTTFSLPDNGSHAAHDNITNTDVVVSIDWGTNYNITINVYSNGFAEKLHTVTTKANIIEDTAFQDICAYNGKVYVLTFKNLYEIDVVTGDVNIISISTLQEIEGCTFIDDEFYVFTHQIGANYVEYIYSYQDDYEPQFYNRLLPNYIQRTLDVSLNKFVAMGDYYVDSADTTNKNYPTGETKGYLHVVNRSGMGDDNYLIISEQEFHSLTAPYSVYQRLYFRGSIGWTPWQKVDHINSAGNGWIRYENGLQLCCGTKEITTSYNVGGAYPYRGAANITFPVPFSSKPCVFSSVNESINYWISGAKDPAVSNFMIMMCGNQNNATREVEWYAIGYWK